MSDAMLARRELIALLSRIGIGGLLGGTADRSAAGSTAMPAAFPAAAKSPRGTAHMEVGVRLDRDRPGVTMTSRFVGLSYEKDKLRQPMFTPGNDDLLGLYRLLGPGVLRIGANAVDRCAWLGGVPGLAPIQSGMVDALTAFAKQADWQVIYGINLANNTPRGPPPRLPTRPAPWGIPCWRSRSAGRPVELIFDHVEKVKSKLAKAQQYADMDAYYGPDGIYDKLVTVGLPKELTFRDIRPLQAADFWALEYRKNHLTMDEWWCLEDRPQVHGEEQWEHLRQWVEEKYGSFEQATRKSAQALIRRNDMKCMIWHYQELCDAHKARGGVWS